MAQTKREILVKFVVPSHITTDDFIDSLGQDGHNDVELVTEGYEFEEIEVIDTGDMEHNAA